MKLGVDGPRYRVCIVGSGTAFVSGISYYTHFLAKSLTEKQDVSVILMRRLIPRRLYPGRLRVGTEITRLKTAEVVPTFDGVDWFALPSVPRALTFMRRQRPEILVLQWWSGSVLPWYLIFAWLVRRSGGSVIIEFHEDLDTGEAALPVVGSLVRRGLRRLIAWSSGYVVHSAFDRDRLAMTLGLEPGRISVIPHGPFPMGQDPVATLPAIVEADDASAQAVNILFFGTIRPYKGLEHLIRAFDALPRGAGERWRLTVVGETWESWTLPLELIAASAHQDDITLVNRYVTDDEVPGFFRDATVVALPYLRSSASGPLHLTMTSGLPVVITSVGGLVEAAGSYTGVVVVAPASDQALVEGIQSAVQLRGQAHEDPHSWRRTAALYSAAIGRSVSSTNPPALVSG